MTFDMPLNKETKLTIPVKSAIIVINIRNEIVLLICILFAYEKLIPAKEAISAVTIGNF